MRNFIASEMKNSTVVRSLNIVVGLNQTKGRSALTLVLLTRMMRTCPLDVARRHTKVSQLLTLTLTPTITTKTLTMAAVTHHPHHLPLLLQVILIRSDLQNLLPSVGVHPLPH